MEFVNVDKKINLLEIDYWLKMFRNNIKIGTEIETMYQDALEDGVTTIKNLLKDDGLIGGNFNHYQKPVEEVKSDGSLTNGAEILTPGRRLYNWLSMYSMYKPIINSIMQYKPIISPRMGWHNHVALDVDNNHTALEMPIPYIIFANIYQIVKKYYPALAFITSTMTKKYGESLTRYNEYCVDNRMLCHLPKTLRNIKSYLSERYNGFNVNYMKDNNDGDIKEFHIEFRLADGTVFPAQMATINCIYLAIILKAVKMAGIGQAQITNEEYEKMKHLYQFRNMDDTDSRLSSKALEVDELKAYAKEFVDFIETELEEIDTTALHFARKLSQEPISLMSRRLDTDDVEKINIELDKEVNALYAKTGSIEELSNLIVSEAIKDVTDEEDWVNKASEKISAETPIDEMLNVIKGIIDLKFTPARGYYI